ncbi:MAG: ABC transporter substrate-binding protein [Hyphomicrobiales bacterium]|nr:ABC transporter substrate-binding protein [Hyphomicrobiales bacterium]
MFPTRRAKLFTPTRRSFLAGAGAFAAATQFPIPAIGQGKKDLVYGGFGAGYSNLNPLQRTDNAAGIIMRNVFDALVRPDYAAQRVVPELAVEWSRPDALTWRIKLREGVKWHKGYGEMTAEDVVYSWMTCLQDKCFQTGTALFPLESIKADGKYVVEAKMKQPFGAFPGVTMGYGGNIICKAAHQEMGNAYNLTPIGTGAFQVEQASSNEIIVARNSDYWNPNQPQLDRIVFRAIPDSQVRLQSLERGELDFISQPDTKDVEEIKSNDDLVYTSTPGWVWDYQQFCLKGNDGMAFQDKRVRQAISYAIDREAIVKEIYNGEALPTDYTIPPGFMGYKKGPLRYPKNGDLAKAKELMAAAGVSGYEVEVICSDKDWLRRELELVAAMVSQIGITYKIRNLDIGSFNNLWLNKNFQQHLEDITIVAPDTDATCWWFYHSQGNVTAGYDNPEMDKLLDEARASSDTDERIGLYDQVTSVALEDQPLVIHCNPNLIRAYRKGLQGFEPGPQANAEWFKDARWS